MKQIGIQRMSLMEIYPHNCAGRIERHIDFNVAARLLDLQRQPMLFERFVVPPVLISLYGVSLSICRHPERRWDCLAASPETRQLGKRRIEAHRKKMGEEASSCFAIPVLPRFIYSWQLNLPCSRSPGHSRSEKT